MDKSRPSPRTKWTRCVPHPVLIGRAACLTPRLQVLVPAISTESVVALLAAADRFAAPLLLDATLRFVTRHFAEVVASEEYQALEARLMLLVQARPAARAPLVLSGTAAHRVLVRSARSHRTCTPTLRSRRSSLCPARWPLPHIRRPFTCPLRPALVSSAVTLPRARLLCSDP